MKIVVLDSTAVGGVTSGPGSAAYFSRFAIEHLLDLGHEVHITNHLSPLVAEADVVWSEWCNEIAFEAALRGICKKLIIRMRGYDVWSPLDKMPWKNVHALVCESHTLSQLVQERMLTVPVPMYTIAGGVDLDSVPFSARSPAAPIVALIAIANERKGYQIAFEWARQNPQIQLHVTTALGESNPRLMRYLHYAKPDNAYIHGNVDTIPWLESINANFLLSASIWEDLGYTIAEAMAMGIKPLIHDAPGNATNWPLEFLWRSLHELTALLTGPYNSDVYRHYIERHLSAKSGSEAFAKLVIG